MGEQATEVRRCGRTTKSGKPCQVQLYGYDLACSRHASEHDRELATAYARGHREGHASGYEMGTSLSKSTVQRLEQRIKDLEAQLDEATRIYEVNGDQVVEVGRYAYRWRGRTPPEVGARVLLPENWLSAMKDGRGPHVGVVTKLGTTYRGELSSIVGLAPDEGAGPSS